MRHFLLLAFVPLVAALGGVPLSTYAEEDGEVLATQEELSNPESDTETNAEQSKALGLFSVAPAVVSQKAKARDILKEQVTVTNHSSRKVNLYVDVLDILPDGETPPPKSLEASLARWVEITRGVIELAPEETRTIPYLIHINMRAVPGVYHARVRFLEGSNRASAKEHTGPTSMLMTVEVEDDARERLELGGFVATEPLVTGGSAHFNYRLENVGNREVAPRGEIRIFNRKGEEVGVVPVNPDGRSVMTSAKEQLAAAWDTSGRFGKYKAFLDIEYGDNQLATVNDTVYFWVFPWREVLFALIGVVVLAFMGTYAMHTRAVSRRPQPAYVPMGAVSFEPAAAPEPVPPTPRRGIQQVTAPPSQSRERAFAAPVGYGTVELSSRQERSSAPGHVVQLAPRRR